MRNKTLISMITATGVLLASLSVPGPAMADSGFIKTKAPAVEHSVENEGGLIKVRDHRRKGSHRRHKSRNRHRGHRGHRGYKHHRRHGRHGRHYYPYYGSRGYNDYYYYDDFAGALILGGTLGYILNH